MPGRYLVVNHVREEIAKASEEIYPDPFAVQSAAAGRQTSRLEKKRTRQAFRAYQQPHN